MVAARLGPSALFVDTSVIVLGLIDFGERSRSAQRLFDRLARLRAGRPRTAWHCCLEFYSVATRLPQEFRLRAADAASLLGTEVLARFEVLDLPARDREELLATCAREDVLGGRLYDAHIAAAARSARSRIVVTENSRHFAGLEREGIRVLDAERARRALNRSGRASSRP